MLYNKTFSLFSNSCLLCLCKLWVRVQWKLTKSLLSFLKQKPLLLLMEDKGNPKTATAQILNLHELLVIKNDQHHSREQCVSSRVVKGPCLLLYLIETMMVETAETMRNTRDLMIALSFCFCGNLTEDVFFLTEWCMRMNARMRTNTCKHLHRCKNTPKLPTHSKTHNANPYNVLLSHPHSD